MTREPADHVRRFYEAHRDELYAYALSIARTREAAEDAIHTAFHNILQRALPRDLKPYVFRCVRNAAIDELRARGRADQHAELFVIDEERNNGHDPALQHHLAELVLKLSEDERESVLLKMYSGMTFQEIADVRGVSINTAASWYRRGIEKLREMMQEDQ
jgi:RNA polymerase sigma-70 factor (ECF subfamily)